jgi:hypothetical protein
MKIDKEALESLIDEATKFEDIKTSDIPYIDLYMDQVTTIFEEKLSTLKRYPSEKILTKTMINNYAKDKILAPPIKKKYSHNHIILLNLIYNLKQSLAISDIKELLSPLNELMESNKNSTEIDKLYNAYLEIKSKDLKNCRENFIEILNDPEEATIIAKKITDEKLEMLLLVLILINEANTRRILAEKIVDKYFK